MLIVYFYLLLCGPVCDEDRRHAPDRAVCRQGDGAGAGFDGERVYGRGGAVPGVGPERLPESGGPDLSALPVPE